MPAKQEPNIGINYGWDAGESGINLQLDENWRAIGALLQLSVISKTTDVPTSPVAGDRYIVPAGATGDWSGYDGKVARYNEGVWEIYTPLRGWLAFIEDEAGDGQYQFFDGVVWAPAPIDDAGQVIYSNTNSGLTAQDVQSAIDELAAEPGGVTSVDGQTGAVDLSGSYEQKRQNNLSATTDPTATDDASAGYEPLSRWINTSTGEIWLCVDATNGAANWQKASLTLDELGSAALADVGTGGSQVPTNADLPTASETAKGMIEKATTAEAEAGTPDKFPDAAGVHAAFNQYGLGGSVEVFGGDIDSFNIPNGSYFVNVSTSGTKPPNVNYGILHQVHLGNDGHEQKIVRITSDNSAPRIFYRKGVAASVNLWSGWVEMFHTGNILGTVSQSGGVPTGAILEYISNSNGKALRYADGSQIAWNDNSAITSDPASFVGTPTSVDGDKLKMGRWY